MYLLGINGHDFDVFNAETVTCFGRSKRVSDNKIFHVETDDKIYHYEDLLTCSTIDAMHKKIQELLRD